MTSAGIFSAEDEPSANKTIFAAGVHDNQSLPKPKRLACLICRKRKLRCDGARPSCSTCSRLGHNCGYDEVRKKSGPKRGYVKALEERLKQVESLLHSQGSTAIRVNSFSTTDSCVCLPPASDLAIPRPFTDHGTVHWQANDSVESTQTGKNNFNFNTNMFPEFDTRSCNSTNEVMQLGLQEPSPPQDVIDELHHIYFQKIAPTSPIVHKYRYLLAMNMAPIQRPPVCLRYAIWTMAASVSDKYIHYRNIFYERARRYLEADYIKGHGEYMISVAHAQTHILLAIYEFKMLYFPRAWMSTGSAVRLCHMMGLHRLDRTGLDAKQCIAPPRDWTEKEERRRTFWMAFCEDRYASIGTGWPMIIDENDIDTNLPVSENAFELSQQEKSQTLKDAMNPSGAGKLTPFGSNVLMACLFGRNLIHLHCPDSEDKNDELSSEFWKRHRLLDNILLNISLCLPVGLKLPAGLQSPNIIFTNMCIHTSTICLHQAAIFTADKHHILASISRESKIRCVSAANEITSIMRMVSHIDLATMNPFVSFCLYVAARVFIQYLKSLPDDSKTIDSLRFLLSAMNALKSRNPLTESFLVQLHIDLETLGTRIPKLKAQFQMKGDDLKSRRDYSNLIGRLSKSSDSLNYQNECLFMKTMSDDGNPVSGIGITNPSDPGQQQEPSMAGMKPCSAKSPKTISHDSKTSWISNRRQDLAQREKENNCRASRNEEGLSRQVVDIMLHSVGGHSKSFESPNTSARGIIFDSNEVSIPPETSILNGPTPIPSIALDRLFNNCGEGNIAPPSMTTITSGLSPFSANPFSSDKLLRVEAGGSTNIPSSTKMELLQTAMQPTQCFPPPIAEDGINASQKNNTNGAQSNFWNIPSPQQSESTDGMLRSLLNMDSLEMMDVNWETISQ